MIENIVFVDWNHKSLSLQLPPTQCYNALSASIAYFLH